MCIIIIWHKHTRFLKMHGTGYWWPTDVNDKLFEKKNLLKFFTPLPSSASPVMSHTPAKD